MSFKLLIIDDDEDIQLILGSILRTLPQLRVEFAATGLEAEQKLENGGFQGVILDYQLPDISGEALLEKILGLDVDPPPQVVMLTARDDQALHRTWLQKGVSAVHKKPFDPLMMLSALRDDFGF